MPEQSPRGHDDDEEVEAEGDIVVEVEGPGEENEEDINPWSSEEPSSFPAVHPTRALAYSQPLPIRISSPGPRVQHVVHRLASLRFTRAAEIPQS
jgi:hypothetical protein